MCFPEDARIYKSSFIHCFLGTSQDSLHTCNPTASMLFSTIAMIALSALPFLATAIPVDTPTNALAAAKAHNIYLVTCVPRSRKNDDDIPAAAQNFTAIAYFKKPIDPADTSSKGPQPDKSALVSQPPEAWEGAKWKVKVWKDKLFTAEIPEGAQTLAKGDIAGSVNLGDEDYACFKDGETAIRIRDDDLRGKCVADYFCAGLGKGDDGL